MSWSEDQLIPHHSLHLNEQTLFPVTLCELEAETRVSADEMSCWHNRSWLSFDPTKMAKFDCGERTEVEFIRSIARSGLRNEWIDRLLARLEKPYCYDSDATLFSFSRGSWVSLPPRIDEPPIEEEIDRYLKSLAEDEDWETLKSFQRTTECLLELESEEAETDE